MAWLGGAIPLFFRWRPLVIHLFISLGAGILLGAAFLHMLPDSAEYIGSKLGPPALLGFLLLYILEKFILTHPCPSDYCEYHHVGLMAFIGLSVHSLITGMALGAGILIPKLGLVVFFAVVLHKLPASLSLSSLLVKEKYKIQSIAVIILIFSFMIPIGAFLTYFFAKGTTTVTLGYLIAFSSGTFFHVAADDLLPEVHSRFDHRKESLATFLLGILIMWLIAVLE
ncbi:zinc transporter ZupT [bacterium BMS3Abin05]|nr:zinc transporter ZupT [bacterium BMS3Abin05]GBE28540.1 zinc transporter ZupT [bacterium BMS3Bbin03]